MSDFQHVPQATEESYKSLADLVSSTLITGGLPAHYYSINFFIPGAEIIIDTGDDSAGGVYVSWRTSEQLSQAATAKIREGNLSDPIIEYSGSIKVIMRDAIIGILSLAGFSVLPTLNDMNPLAILVQSGPGDTPSRDLGTRH